MMEVTKMITEQLKSTRARAGLTQAHMSEALGVSQGMISHFESGRKAITPANLDRWMTACQVSARQRSKLVMMWFEEAVQRDD